MDPLLRFLASSYNKILGTELSIYWKIFGGGIGVIFVLALIFTVYAKAKKRLGHKKETTTEPEQKPVSSKDKDKSETLPCWKCQRSVPIEEYAGHVDQCVLQKPTVRV